MPKILVAGASGLVGYAAIKHFESEFNERLKPVATTQA